MYKSKDKQTYLSKFELTDEKKRGWQKTEGGREDRKEK